MSETVKDISQGLAQATTGPGTPDDMRILKPNRDSVYTLLGALAVVWLFGLTIIAILGYGKWSPEMPVSLERIHGLAWMGLGAVICIGVIVIALASSRLGHVNAEVGGARFDVAGRPDDGSMPDGHDVKG